MSDEQFDKTFEYDAIAFRQQADAPIQVTFVANATEILQWSGVPRKSDELLTGYQRFRDSERVNTEIAPFFKNPKNSSPTAIIVALRNSPGIGRYDLEDQVIDVKKAVKTKIRIRLNSVALLSREKIRTAVLSYLSPRIEQDTIPTEPDDVVLDSDLGGDEINLGSVTLRSMMSLVTEDKNWENEEFVKSMADFARPAFLIDGQHRVSAGALMDVPFVVCALVDAGWEEQVFQFTIVNLKPKRIPTSLITSIAALSLTKTEQQSLQARLIKAGIRLTEVEIMSMIAYEDKSPFAELIDMGVNPERRHELLGYGSMKRVAAVWYKASRKSLTIIARHAYQTNKITSARKSWREEMMWFRFFCSFWTAIRDVFGEELWQKSPSKRLLNGANLWALQEAILGVADGQMARFWALSQELNDGSLDERVDELNSLLMEVVRETAGYIPVEVWTTQWQKVGQDTHSGRKELVQLFDGLIKKGEETGQQYRHWRKLSWFKKPAG